MPFVKGQSGNPLGRRKRTPEETAAAHEFMEGCKRLLPTALARCEKILKDKHSEPQVVVRITEMLADRVMGKPAQAITGADGGPIILKWEQ